MLARLKSQKAFGNIFVFIVILFVIFLYVTNFILGWMIFMPTNAGKIIFLIVGHLFFFMFIWSFLQTIFSDPGPVPLYWGFFLDDPEHKKRRYCLACHIFKPERCHHCSVCNRCVLNMDHHCPWINNCVGFYNRKFFLLMLFYVVMTSFILLCGNIAVHVQIIDTCMIGKEDCNWALNAFIFIGFIADSILFFVILFFFKFHCTLVYQNMTTIEHLESKRSSLQTNYDSGFWYNFYQIFGSNWMLWPFPLFLESGKPVGDGVVWFQRYKETVIENNELNNSDASINRKIQNSDENIKRAAPIEPINHYVHNDKGFSPNMNPNNNYSAGLYSPQPQPQIASPYHSNYYAQDVKYDRNMNRTDYSSSTYNANPSVNQYVGYAIPTYGREYNR